VADDSIRGGIMIHIEEKELLAIVGSLFASNQREAKNDFTDILAKKLKGVAGESIRYNHEFTYEGNFQIRFNYIPACKGDEWTPVYPEEVEIVQVLFFSEPLTVNQERAFIEEHEEELMEMCWEEWSKHQDFDQLTKTRKAV